MRNIFLAAFIIHLAAPLQAQTSGGGSSPERALQETGRMLSQAQSNTKTEAARQTADRTADKGRLGQLANEAKSKLTNPSGDSDKKLVDAVDQRLEPALRSAAPEGRAIIAQSAAAPATRAPDPDAPQGGGSPKAPTRTGAADGKKGKAAEPPPSDIDIQSEGAVYLDSVKALAIFTDDVVLVHPQFHMTSDKLEVYFIKETAKKAEPEKNGGSPKAPDPGSPPKARLVDAPAAAQSGDATLKQAIATGRKVVIRKLDENGEPQIGICRHLTYIGESGDVILREMPQVQRGTSVIIARDSSTYMVMKQNGELKVHGPADTKLQQKPVPGGKAKPAAPAPAAPVPSTPALTPKSTPKKSAKK